MRKPKQEPPKPKRSEAQRRADEKYKEKDKINHRENFKNIAATFRRDEAERIAEIFKAHGVKPSEVLRGAAAALLDGEPIRTESAPLTAPQAAGEAQPAPAPVEDDGTDGGEE